MAEHGPRDRGRGQLRRSGLRFSRWRRGRGGSWRGRGWARRLRSGGIRRKLDSGVDHHRSRGSASEKESSPPRLPLCFFSLCLVSQKKRKRKKKKELWLVGS